MITFEQGLRLVIQEFIMLVKQVGQRAIFILVTWVRGADHRVICVVGVLHEITY